MASGGKGISVGESGEVGEPSTSTGAVAETWSAFGPGIDAQSRVKAACKSALGVLAGSRATC
jgi:hypothetical protein